MATKKPAVKAPSAAEAQRLCDARDEAKMSQPEFAAFLCSGLQTLRNWENRRRPIPAWVWALIEKEKQLKRLLATVARLKEAA